MEVNRTQYFVAVEIAGAVEFGSTKVLNAAQWVAAFEPPSKPATRFFAMTSQPRAILKTLSCWFAKGPG